jgi:hypothetical protein
MAAGGSRSAKRASSGQPQRRVERAIVCVRGVDNVR